MIFSSHAGNQAQDVSIRGRFTICSAKEVPLWPSEITMPGALLYTLWLRGMEQSPLSTYVPEPSNIITLQKKKKIGGGGGTVILILAERKRALDLQYYIASCIGCEDITYIQFWMPSAQFESFYLMKKRVIMYYQVNAVHISPFRSIFGLFSSLFILPPMVQKPCSTSLE